MRLLIVNFLSVLVLVSIASVVWGVSDIGLYITPAPDLSSSRESIMMAGGPGLYDIYLVCTEPVNEHTGLPIETLGGFELTIVMPEDWFVNGIELPPNVLDFNSANHSFHCAGVIPVTSPGEFPLALLATVTIGTFTQYPPVAWIHVEPYYAPSYPDQMAITDANDDFSISPAYPSSGDYDRPVFQINYQVPNEDQSWGAVKALFK